MIASAPSGEQESTVAVVNHDYATVNGHRLFYREAGAADAPVIVLLHGFRGSSHATRWQYLTGVVDQTLVDPDAWLHDYVSLCRPGIDEVHTGLRDQPYAGMHLLDGGHFLLESALDEVASLITTFLKEYVKGD